MNAVCLIDTSIFDEILNIPMKANRHEEIMEELKRKVDGSESLFLPMATIFESGNHVGQNGDGVQRRACAERFVNLVKDAMKGEAPFKPLNFLDRDQMFQWLDSFPDHVGTGSGLGDLSIIQDWERECQKNMGRRVYIWTLDGHLTAYDRAPTI
ncbi:MAG: hypothetical protein GVY36_13605 [Verrucomicrobia bacterium]|nr:hypothetical protein [Verrucomicrobiota bacterium]